MKIRPGLSLIALVMLSACGSEHSSEQTSDVSEDFAVMLDEHFVRSLELDPVHATEIGEDKYDDKCFKSTINERDAKRYIIPPP